MATVTIDGNNYDVYVTVADCTEYLAGDVLLSDDWSTAVNPEQALVSATRLIDRQTWQGDRTDVPPTQPLEWPRTGVTDKYGNAVDSASVPQSIIDACCILAGLLVQDSTLFEQQDTGSNIRKLKAGSAEIENFKPTSAGKGATKFPPQVQELLGQYLASGATLVAPVSYGTAITDAFGTGYGLNKGYC